MIAEKMIQDFEKALTVLSKILQYISAAVLFLIMLLTVLDVLLRKLINHSILGTVEVSEFMLVVVVFFGLAYTELMDGHVKVDFIVRRFKKTTRSIIDIVINFAAFLLSAVMVWCSINYVLKMKNSGEVSQDLWLPVYPFVFVVVIGFTVFCLVLLLKLLKNIIGVIKK